MYLLPSTKLHEVRSALERQTKIPDLGLRDVQVLGVPSVWTDSIPPHTWVAPYLLAFDVSVNLVNVPCGSRDRFGALEARYVKASTLRIQILPIMGLLDMLEAGALGLGFLPKQMLIGRTGGRVLRVSLGVIETADTKVTSLETKMSVFVSNFITSVTITSSTDFINMRVVVTRRFEKHRVRVHCR